jgi:hypothetical protein
MHNLECRPLRSHIQSSQTFPRSHNYSLHTFTCSAALRESGLGPDKVALVHICHCFQLIHTLFMNAQHCRKSDEFSLDFGYSHDLRAIGLFQFRRYCFEEHVPFCKDVLCSFGEGWKGPCFLNYVIVLQRFALSYEAAAMSFPPMLFFQKLLSESSLGIREATSHV